MADEEAPQAAAEQAAPAEAPAETAAADEAPAEPPAEQQATAEPTSTEEPTPAEPEQQSAVEAPAEAPAAAEETEAPAQPPAEEEVAPAEETPAAEPPSETAGEDSKPAEETSAEEAPPKDEQAAKEEGAEETQEEKTAEKPKPDTAPDAEKPAEEEAPKAEEEQQEEEATPKTEETPKAEEVGDQQEEETAAPQTEETTKAEEVGEQQQEEAAAPQTEETPKAEESPKPEEPATEQSKPEEAGGEEPKQEATPAAEAEKQADEKPDEAANEKPAAEPVSVPVAETIAEPAAEPVAQTAAQEPAAPAAEQPKAAAPKPPSPKVERGVKEQKMQTSHGINLEATATVKFVLMPSGQVVTLACMLGQTLQDLKVQFASELKMPLNLILLMFDGKSMSDATTLADLGVGPNGTVQLEMQSADPVNNPIRSYRPRQEYQMPDVITVRVQTEEGEAKDVVVEIERATSKKPFLGGFRHKVSGAEFHNAAAQTLQKPKMLSGIERYCRDTQTVQQHHSVQQTFNDTSTQMTGIGVFISNMEDKLMTPGKYTLAEDHLYMILQKVVLIQKYYRRWLAKRYVSKLKDDKRQRLEWERQEEIRKQKEKEERIKREFERRMQPKSKEDFDLLYSALEKWRVEELERINNQLTGAERKAAMCMLLDQETQLLSAIDRHKLETGVDNKQQRIQDFLEKAAAPKKWHGFDGKATEMDTPYTLRAKELRDIYNSINMKYLTQDERLDVLLTLKHTVKEHDCKLTQEIIELIDREADLLMRGVKEGNLTGLRKRISTLFLQYIKTPTFNPEAAHLLKVPQDPSTLRKNIYFCSSCNKYLPSTEFYLSSNSRTPGKCRGCLKIDNDARIRHDYSHYRRMLKALRRSEESYQDGSQIAFLMQESDLRYLVENIWSGQSVLSAWEDLYDLVLVRWDRHAQWSPWNCVLLTNDEAKAHNRLVSLDEPSKSGGYGDVFIQKIKQKHTLARNYFSRLPGMAELMRMHGGDKSPPMAPGPSSIAGQALNMQTQKV
ncbi:hypothetical protein ACOMHN_053756 [Nucella lapillus]